MLINGYWLVDYVYVGSHHRNWLDRWKCDSAQWEWRVSNSPLLLKAHVYHQQNFIEKNIFLSRWNPRISLFEKWKLWTIEIGLFNGLSFNTSARKVYIYISYGLYLFKQIKFMCVDTVTEWKGKAHYRRPCLRWTTRQTFRPSSQTSRNPVKRNRVAETRAVVVLMWQLVVE